MKKKNRVLIIVENLPLPFDRRVWQEATTLRKNGYQVAIICPKGRGYSEEYELLEGIHIYRHPLPLEAEGALGYLLEYSSALYFEFMLSLKILARHGFDIIHACNPPDDIFLIGWFYKFFFGKRFLFDHHDINPELYIAKFGKKDRFYRLMLLWERLTFKTADISIATNDSYRKIAIQRGGMKPEDVFVVRSGPDLKRVKKVPPHPKWKKGRKFLVGYVGVMGAQEGLDMLLKGIAWLIHDLKRHDTHFLLIGGGTELEALKELANQLKIDPFVTFTGRVPDGLLMEALSTADICVNPDIVNDMNDKSTMNKIMEYMGLGKPIVQFEMTEGRFSADEASLYARPNDVQSFMEKIQHLLDDPALREKMGAFGIERVKNNLEWRHEIPKLLAAYEAVQRK